MFYKHIFLLIFLLQSDFLVQFEKFIVYIKVKHDLISYTLHVS